MVMAAKRKPEWLTARQTITVEAGGRRFPLLAGVTRVPSDHPAAKAQRDAFAPDDTDGRS